jgi:hypothetical protein
VLVVAAPAAVVLVWGRWMAPKSQTRVRDPWRLAIELLVFGGAALALWDADELVLAIVLAAATLIHLGLTFAFDHREV